jgi:hypothetical protein
MNQQFWPNFELRALSFWVKPTLANGVWRDHGNAQVAGALCLGRHTAPSMLTKIPKGLLPEVLLLLPFTMQQLVSVPK